MSLRTYKQITMIGALVLGALGAGCGDDPKKPKDDVDAGNQGDGDGDMANPGDGDGDMMSGGPKSVMCGSTLCEGQVILGMFPVDACCAGAAQDKCGYDGTTLPPPATLPGCLERDAPGVASEDVCGAFFDQVETDPGADKTDKLLFVKSDTISLKFSGCCTEQGVCGANLAKPVGFPIDLHLGCVGYNTLQSALAGDGDAGAPDPSSLSILPFCEPTTGGARVTGTVPGVPSFICGCGETADSPGADGLPCLNKTGASVCGADGAGTPSFDEALAQIPEFVCGATGSTSGLPVKLKGLASTVCGKAEVTDATSALLDGVPEFFCGAEGAPAGSNPAFLLPNVPNSICGKQPVDANSTVLGLVPEFLCGDGAAPASVSPLLLLRNVEYSVCGKQPVNSDSPILTQVPEFLCGKEGAPNGMSIAFLLPNVENAVCGKLPVDAESGALAGVPEFVCGAENAPAGSNPLMLLRNVDTAVCGKYSITQSAQLESAGLPEFLCGCGDGAQSAANMLPCLRNVVDTACGNVDIDTQAKLGLYGGELFPNAVCGCGENQTSQHACLDNVAQSICGLEPICTLADGEVFGEDKGSCENAAAICHDSNEDEIGDACVGPT